MSGQLLVCQPDQAVEKHLRVRIRRFEDAARQGRELRFVDQRTFGGLSAVSEGGAELPPEIAHIARDPFDPEFDDDLFVRGSGEDLAASSAPCSTRRSMSGDRQHLRRRGALAGPDPRRPARRAPDARRRTFGARGGPRQCSAPRSRRAARASTPCTSTRTASGLLRPLPSRLRARRGAVRPLRHPDPPCGVHEPLVVLLPTLPTGAPRPEAGAGILNGPCGGARWSR